MRRTGLRRHVWSENGNANHGYCPVQVSLPADCKPLRGESAHTGLSCPHSFGYYFAILPALLNVISFIGFCAVNSIVAGQVLAAVNPGHLSVNAGIVIVAVISMLVSFCGYKVLHTMERWAWMPVLLAFICLAGFGARHLGSAPSFAASEPATAGAVLSFISIVVGFTISWSGCSADFNTYMRPDISSIRVCLYTFAGLYLPCMLVQVMGAAFAAAALSGAVPTWEEAFGDGSVGGLVGVAVEPMRGFGKFLLVLFSLGMICKSSDPLNRGFLRRSPLTYDPSHARSQQRPDPIRLLALAPDRLPLLDETASLPPPDRRHGHLPPDRHRRRCTLCECAEQLSRPARVLELDLCRHLTRRGESRPSCQVARATGYSHKIPPPHPIQHLLFRKGRFSAYNLSFWNRSSQLPPGLAALFASLCGAALVVVGMDQVWFRGPLAKLVTGTDAHAGGDIAFETGMAVAAAVYIPARWLERRTFVR